jgi:hypothetical protein
MPNRVIRDGYVESERVNRLSPHAECFFFRLMLKADDFGRFNAHTGLLRAHLYPLKLETIREADISRWLTEVEKAGLIALYEGPGGKRYLVIPNFDQRVRAEKSKFPDPPDSCLTDDRHMTVICQHSAALDGDGDGDGVEDEVSHTQGSQLAEIPSLEEVKAYADRIGLAPWRAEDWWREMESTGWMLKGQRLRKWRAGLDRVRVWWEEDGKPMKPPQRFPAESGRKPRGKPEGNLLQEKITVKAIKIDDGNA